MADQDVFHYQREVWSRSDVAGYNELIDMSQVAQIVRPPADRVRQLAQLSAAKDPPTGRSRFAIVAPQDVAFGIGRMYEAYRESAHGTKEVGVFRTIESALTWLGVDAVPEG